MICTSMKTHCESSRYATRRRCERLGAKISHGAWEARALSGSTRESNKMTDIEKEERGDYKVIISL